MFVEGVAFGEISFPSVVARTRLASGPRSKAELGFIVGHRISDATAFQDCGYFSLPNPIPSSLQTEIYLVVAFGGISFHSVVAGEPAESATVATRSLRDFHYAEMGERFNPHIADDVHHLLIAIRKRLPANR